MRNLLLPLSSLALIGATEPTAPNPAPSPQSVTVVHERDAVTPTPEHCHDRITQARAAAGKAPLLERELASPDKPYHIYAVDRRQDGCAVMVMHGDPADIRPLPARPEAPERMIPLANRR